MADFTVVHKRALSEASYNLRTRPAAEVWNIALEEPLRFDGEMSQSITVIQVCLGAGRKIHLANPSSLAALQEWKERFKDTPNEAFEFPRGVIHPVGTSGDRA